MHKVSTAISLSCIFFFIQAAFPDHALFSIPEFLQPLHWASLRRIWLCLSFKPILGLQVDPTKPSLSRLRKPSFPLPLLIRHVHQSSKHLSSFLLNSLQFISFSITLGHKAGQSVPDGASTGARWISLRHLVYIAGPRSTLNSTHTLRDTVWLNLFFILLKVGHFPQTMLLIDMQNLISKKKITFMQEVYELW